MNPVAITVPSKRYFACKWRNLKFAWHKKRRKEDKKKKKGKEYHRVPGPCPLDSQTNALPIAPLGNNLYMSHCF